MQRIIFNFHKKNPAKATQDDHNDDDNDDDEAHDDAPDDDSELADDVVNNIVATTLVRCCVSLKFQRDSHATFVLLLWFSQRKTAAKLRKNFAMEHLLVHRINANIILPFFL